ncbi:hypothetical protein IE53DRAFT_371120 [Violaceomyces palustris]|uniref:Uncharacterized protein n=1 Tax=Violaceomyces palustris TaxID=1673888 RepID=A0ACD0NPV4_9BASI|nr:hypothetical protein IE53DRAFT_371120 [Violaceomyces palustris]
MSSKRERALDMDPSIGDGDQVDLNGKKEKKEDAEAPLSSPSKKNSSWTNEEHAAFISCLNEMVKENLKNHWKKYPELGPRKLDGCNKKWHQYKVHLEKSFASKGD